MKFSLIIVLGVAILTAINSAFDSGAGAQTPSPGQTDNARTKHFRLGDGRLAIDGYDPVSYFKNGPQKGSKDLIYDYNGVVYRFANTANLAEFKANPDRYEPAWGGWCGHAMAMRGEKVTINPECYKIIGGRNVLFYRTVFANALTNWEKELQKTPENTLMQQGDAFWGKIIVK